MNLQPSASRTALLLACPRPFDPELDVELEEPGEPARYGSAFHQVIAACLRGSAKKPLEKSIAAYTREINRATKKFDVVAAAQELAGHVKSSVQVLRKWLARENLIVQQVETARAVHATAIGDWTRRTISPHDEDHRYDVVSDEVPGTIDLVAANSKRIVVLDHKTGGIDENFARPSLIPQMRTLGLVELGARSAVIEVAIFHADRRGLPIVYSEEYEPVEQHKHAAALAKAVSRIGQGFLRPGPYCRRCPARTTCPAHAADLLAESSAALVQSASALAVEPIQGPLAPATGASIEQRAGALYDLLKKFRALEKAGSEEIKRLVREGAVIETRTGEVLALRKQSYETLSKKSVIEALGKVAGERELEKLRKKGALRETTREMLVPEK